MKDVNFDSFFSKVILKVIKNEKAELNRLLPDESIKFNLRYKYDLDNEKAVQKFKEELRDSYEAKKIWLKRFAHYKGDSGVIDKHKIASVFMAVMIDVKPIKFDINDNLDEIMRRLVLTNYFVAFKVACGVIYLEIITALDDRKLTEELTVLKNHKKLVYPNVSKGHKNFEQGIANFLYLNDRANIEFDYLSHSNFMFF